MKKSVNLKKEPTLDDALLELRRVMTEELRKKAQKMGQSVAHLEVLKFIAERGDPTMRALADHLGITPPSTSTLVERLVKKGLVSRLYSHSDRRTVRLSLTAKSQRLFASLNQSKISIFSTMLKRLGKEDKKQLAKLLAKCTNKNIK